MKDLDNFKNIFSKINLIFGVLWLIILILDFKFDMYSNLWTLIFFLLLILEECICLYIRYKNKK